MTYSSWPFFNHADWLGTERYRSLPTGGQYGLCFNNPFGDNMYCPEADGDISPVHFTGKERDGGNTLSPTNLDNFGARFYSSSMGRFITPDWAAKPAAVPYATFGNPQSLNLYSYVQNNPVTRADADGHCGDICWALIGWASLNMAIEGPRQFGKDVGLGMARGPGNSRTAHSTQLPLAPIRGPRSRLRWTQVRMLSRPVTKCRPMFRKQRRWV